MEKKFAGRVTLISVIVFIFLFGIPFLGGGIFPLGKLLNPSVPWSKKHNLKPGLDIRGGTSLLYEIQAPSGAQMSEDLAQRVADALKRRVDPEGVRNLVWRPQGANRLEIQMPLGENAEQTEQIRKAYAAAQEQLEATNVRPAEVYAALDTADPAVRQQKLDALIAGSPTRKSVVERMAAMRQELRAAQESLREPERALGEAKAEVRRAETAVADLPITASDADRQAAQKVVADARARVNRLEDQLLPLVERVVEKGAGLRALEAELERTNLPVSALQGKLEAAQKVIERYRANPTARAVTEARQRRDGELAELRKQHADFPRRLEAIDAFVKAYDAYQEVKNSVDDAEGLKRLLRGSGVLEFHIAVTTDRMSADEQGTVAAMRARLKAEGPAVKPGDTMRWYEVDNEDGLDESRMISERVGDTLYTLLYITPEKSMVSTEQAPWGLERAFPDFDPQNNQTVVGFQFDARGGSMFGDLTGAHVGRPLAIVLDDRVISSPNLKSQIHDRGVIQGKYTQAQIDYLVRTLTAGSLPAKLADEPISERTVSPTLGYDNLKAGFIASIAGVVITAAFLIGYYYFAGVVAMVAVVMNMIIILGAMAMFNATFTLPGIAALVLTVGMAVDANVLIYERLREEQVRGLSLRLAIRNAYDRAFSAILDSNLTTAVTSIALYVFGSEEVKGFGLTLLIGIISSMFTALFVTRTIFDYGIERLNWKKLGSLPLTFPRWDEALRPKIDWMGKTRYFVIGSTIFTVLGLSAFFFKGRDMYDVEFVEGTSVVLTLKQDTEIGEVRDLLRPYDQPDKLPSASVVSIGNSKRDYEIITPNDNAEQVKDAVLKALEGRLTVDTPSRFAASDLDYDRLPPDEPVVVPVPSATATVEADAARAALANLNLGFTPADLAAHEGGVAVVLRRLDPPITPEEAARRIERARLRDNLPYRKMDVDGNRGPKAPAETLVVLVSDPNLPYDLDDPQKLDRWTSELARPTWKLVRDAISAPPTLERVTNFSPQVAGKAKTDAIIAMIVSTIGIMVYIWIRFGNLKYASASVVGLVHDTLLTIGCVGLSHYLADSFLGPALLIEPFRFNLTIVAAVLTVMGYSLNDTVVIFDRIRENRGKYGYVSRQVINDSINQTMSRTLLTGGTTILTILVMYIFGGSGIHGFTFTLLVGIVIGTYSSIAISAPILLWGGKDVREPAGEAAAAAAGAASGRKAAGGAVAPAQQPSPAAARRAGQTP